MRRLIRALARTTIVVADGQIRVFDGPLSVARPRVLDARLVVALSCTRGRDGGVDLLARLHDGRERLLVGGIPSPALARTMSRALAEALRVAPGPAPDEP